MTSSTTISPAAGAAAAPGGPRRHVRLAWPQRVSLGLFVLDAVVLGAISGLVAAARVATGYASAGGVRYEHLALLLALTWLLGLVLARCYEPRVFLSRLTELVHVARASAQVFATIALLSFVTRTFVSRAFVVVVFAAGAIGLVANRALVHALLRRARRRGGARLRVLAVGDLNTTGALAEAMAGDQQGLYELTATCVPGRARPGTAAVLGRTVPVLLPAGIGAQLTELGVSTVIISASRGVTGELVQQLRQDVAGRGVRVLIAPGLTDVPAGRLHVRPVAGLPLLHLDEPELDGPHKLLKGTFDRSVAATLLLLLLPVLIALWIAVRVTSRGPAIFKQVRVGREGALFLVWKFRSMHPDAEARFESLREFNEHQGPLFKMKNDPRITPAGRFLRKWSLDELPQLVNVLKGDMSLVGPRPPLPAEVAKYDGHAHRRLLVKPGITGLWQVSGRADLDWDQAVRLDLRYVDAWSLGFDVAILMRTMSAVIRGSGAY